MEPGTSGFEATVDRWIVEAVRRDRPGTFDDLLCGLRGVYPTDVQRGVERLARAGDLDEASLTPLRRRAPARTTVHTDQSPLPVPHPLDYDWRFSPSTVDRLTRECERLSRGDPVILLGAPSLLLALRKSSGAPALLLDANPTVVEGLSRGDAYEARTVDLRDGALPAATASLVVLDPPWYPEYERLFLWVAAHLCASGGTALVSLPGDGTRPGVARERELALQWARQLGFSIESREQEALGYISPPFERNALAAAGLAGLPADWRRGDLITLRATGIGDLPPAPHIAEPPWSEVVAGGIRFRIRSRDAQPGGPLDPRLEGIVPGDILDSVSRRDPRRERADVWTSGNRIFGTQSPSELRVILRAVQTGGDPESAIAATVDRGLTAVEKGNIASAVSQTSSLVATETAELIAMGWAP